MKHIGLILTSAILLLFGPLALAINGPKVLNAAVVGSIPNIMIRSITAGGAPWVVQNGKVQLDPSGVLDIRVKGLLIAAGSLANGDPVPPALIGTTGPVEMVHAALTCGGPGGGTPFTIHSTGAVPLSSEGDFEIHELVSLPAVCDQPIVLIRVGTSEDPEDPGPWIAVSDRPQARQVH